MEKKRNRNAKHNTQNIYEPRIWRMNSDRPNVKRNTYNVKH